MITICGVLRRGHQCGTLQGSLPMTTTALQQLTIFIARRLLVQVGVYSGERIVEQYALASQAEVH
jgi:hypothetical protein